MTRATHRSAEEIGRTELGPRPLPPLGEPRAGQPSVAVDTVLDNGLRVIAARHGVVPMVELRLRIPFAGDDPMHPARAEVLAETLLTGTARRDRVQVDKDLATVGGELHAGVDPERLSLSGDSLASGLGTLLDVLADALTGAAYTDREVEGERDRLVERIAVARSQPRVIAREELQRHRYGDHPFVREVPEAEDVAKVTAEQVRALHRESVLPRGSVLVLVGDIDPDQAVAEVARRLSDWQADASAKEIPSLPEVRGGDVRLVHRPGAVQSQLRFSAQALPRTDPRYPALQIANLAFGGYFSSRLVENIREDKGYTYGAHSSFEFTRDNGTLLVDADTASEVTAAALLETRYEFGRLALVPPTEAEVESARQYAIGGLLTSTSSQSGLASMLVVLGSFGLGQDWLVAHPQRLREVTVDQVAEAAALFAPTAFTGVVVGDADKLSDQLRALGGVVLP
ncbi:putative Zn-dependent peptidase [Saccharopolyspora erythraea NRRL 2338]|uniref:Peptidase M16-like n=2 Tax=Saccharopolyspora erythraea TaxID=1836 RepID=A4F8P7_SACEN|nr:pitrilysin family protein [Saccharopolyspora erythraea]EQD85981.1 peptidase M16 [Saccharopolyspora erythraea D]PFG94216.1 putative Zn-dependent peptidase [Saccharopolyspora erythraea NRRL 2338]QRK90993.1 insulinase family protein [Saccharopolyspora erythraea]CAM00422.1 peptidase M16-like [Saccharopolyspora erythraea NRRL 2338]